MRIDVKKFLFCGPIAEKEAFFQKAQELGIIHFINQNELFLKDVPEDILKMSSAIKFLSTLPTQNQEERSNEFDADTIADQILNYKHELEKKAEELRILKLEMERVQIFGKFSAKSLAHLESEGKRKIQFFYAKQGFSENPDIGQGLLFIGSDHNLDYFVAINKEPTSYDHMIEMQIDEPYQDLVKRNKDILQSILEATKKLNPLAKYNNFLHHALIYKLNRYHLKVATMSATSELNGELYFTTGYVPKDKMAEMQVFSQNMNVFVEEIALNKEETLPTYLENEGIHRIGEDLVEIYDTPSNTDTDPSLWVLLGFTLFFSMIIGDAGYGLVFLLTALYIRYKTGALKGLSQRMWVLFVILSTFTIIWGTMAHSFFGIEMSVHSKFHKISALNWLAEKKAAYYLNEKGPTYEAFVKEYPAIKDATTGAQVLEQGFQVNKGVEQHKLASGLNDGIMMEIALLVGIIHLTTGFFRYMSRNWAGVGWVLFMWGCYFYIPSYLKTISMTNYVFGLNVEEASKGGLILIFLGLGLAFVLSIIRHKIWGLLEMMNIIQVFGDVLSYLRLYALGLAGAIVASTINDFAMSTNFIFGTLLFIVGHLINMALGIMGGVIHGLRLNFIEWYHYSFEGGGKKFNPLRNKSIE